MHRHKILATSPVISNLLLLQSATLEPTEHGWAGAGEGEEKRELLETAAIKTIILNLEKLLPAHLRRLKGLGVAGRRAALELCPGITAQ